MNEETQVQKFEQLYVVTFRNDPAIFIPADQARELMDRVDRGHSVKISGEYWAAGEIRSIKKHVVKEWAMAKDVLHEFQGQEREWVRWRIKDKLEKLGKSLTAEEARRFVVSVRDNPEMAPC